MSYCRFSSDDWMCDLYIYENASIGGWTIHVAANRHKREDIPELPPIPVDDDLELEAWAEKYHEQLDAVDKATRIPIDLPHAGETFQEETREATLDRVRELRALGYNVPERVDERLIEEMVEEGQ